ncbi:MAG: exodeoxyribonuclease VII large subunit [Veillonellales bacterium]
MSIFSVSQVTAYIKNLFDHDLKLVSVFVKGEVSNFKQHHSGHCYFTLKDNNATIRAVMFKSRAQFLKFEPQDGLKVLAGGRITVFERDGQYQLYVDNLVPQGVGELSLAFAQLKEKLSREGLFAEERKKKLPLLPKAVGIITSPTGAAVKDIITVSKRRFSGVPLILFPVQVQGAEAPRQIAQAIKVLNNRGGIDVIIVGRGGGSLEELWAFNEEIVVRAVAESDVPVVSAVGHQTDFTLTDFAADIRAATPSQAAEIVIPDARELYRYVQSMRNMLEANILNVIKKMRLRLEQYSSSRVMTHPADLLTAKQQLLDNSRQRLEQALQYKIRDAKHIFTIAAEKLAILSPLAVLSRGYSVLRNQDGRIIRTYNDINIGQKLEVVLYKGAITVEVLQKREEERG